MAVGLLLTSIAVCSVLASSAGAKVIYDRSIHKKIGIFPSFHALTLGSSGLSGKGRSTRIGFSGTPTCDQNVDSSCTSLMTNTGGGPVQDGPEQDFLFFWGAQSSFPSAYVSGMQAFLSGLQAGDYSPDNTSATAGNPLSVVQQYYETVGGVKHFIPLAIQNAGSLFDTAPYPNDCTDSETGYSPTTCVTADDIQTAVTNYIASHNQPGGAPYPTGLNVEYFVLLPPNIGTCDDNTSSACTGTAYCAWHTFATNGSGQPFTFANMPYIQGVPGCDVGVTLNNDGTDSVVSTFSHELAETMTDPELNAWQGSGGGSDEIGDKCGYQYAVGNGSLDPTGLPEQNGVGTSSWYNTTLAGRNYLLQMEFDNSANNGAGGCNQWDTQTQPTATISVPGSITPGVPASFSLTSVTAPAGIAYVNWDFGDGSTGTSTGTAGINHTYATAGNYTVTAIVTDNNGNEVKKTASAAVGGGGGGGVPVYISGLNMSGTFVVGHAITAVPGSWSNNPTSFNYQWYLCNSGGTGCAAIPNATGPSYTLTLANLGHKIKLGVQGVNAAGPGTLVATGASPLVTRGASGASLAIVVTPKFPAPRAPYAVHLAGRALAGGVLGSGHNRSEVVLFEDSGSCALTWGGEAARVRSGHALNIGSAFVAAGPFSLVTHRTATSTQHATVRFCGYLARSATRTDAHATAFYTTT